MRNQLFRRILTILGLLLIGVSVAACNGSTAQIEVEDTSGDEVTVEDEDGDEVTVEEGEDGDEVTIEGEGEGEVTIEEDEDGDQVTVEEEGGEEVTVEEGEDGDEVTVEDEDGDEVTVEEGGQVTIESGADVVSVLETEGLTVNQSDGAELTLDANGNVYTVDGAQLEIYEFDSETSATTQLTAAVSILETTFGGGAVHIYQSGNIVVIYTGDSAEVNAALEAKFGEAQ